MLDFRQGVWYDGHINELKKFGKPDVSQGRKARSFLLYFLQAEGSSAAIAFPARGWLLQSFFVSMAFSGD